MCELDPTLTTLSMFLTWAPSVALTFVAMHYADRWAKRQPNRIWADPMRGLALVRVGTLLAGLIVWGALLNQSRIYLCG